MSKHMRLVVSVLFIVVILLAIAITRSYSSTSRKTGGRSAQTDIERRLDADAAGNRIFEDGSGMFGVIDSSDRVIVAAEWCELSFAGAGKCIASKRIGGTLLKGCVDYEGNVIVPFIYRSVIPRESGDQIIYIAESGTDDTVVVYDSEFRPLLRRVWKDFSTAGNDITLSDENGEYSYSLSEDGISLSKAVVNCTALGCEFSFEVRNADTLRELDPEMLEYMASALGHYLEFAYTGEAGYVSKVRTDGSPVLVQLFPEEKQIIRRKLLGIKSIFFYSTGAGEDGGKNYAVSLSASTEITYSADGSSEPLTITDDYRAVVEFSGSSGNDLKVVSGRFAVSAPDYPEQKKETETDEQGEAQYSGILPSPPQMENGE